VTLLKKTRDSGLTLSCELTLMLRFAKLSIAQTARLILRTRRSENGEHVPHRGKRVHLFPLIIQNTKTQIQIIKAKEMTTRMFHKWPKTQTSGGGSQGPKSRLLQKPRFRKGKRGATISLLSLHLSLGRPMLEIYLIISMDLRCSVLTQH